MNTPKTATDFGEPWSLSSFRNCIYTRDGKLQEIIDDLRNRSFRCVNACAGMSDPAAEIQAMRDAASCLSRLVDHGHAEDCLFLSRANAPCDCGIDQAQAALSKLRSLL